MCVKCVIKVAFVITALNQIDYECNVIYCCDGGKASNRHFSMASYGSSMLILKLKIKTMHFHLGNNTFFSTNKLSNILVGRAKFVSSQVINIYSTQ